MTTLLDARLSRNSLALALSLVSTATLAQTDSILDEVVITASRREESLIDAPLSVAALTKSAMDDQGIRDIEDITLTVPGLRTDERGTGGSGISIRGIFSTTGASTTGVYIDDTSVAVRSGIDANMQPIYAGIFDVERVEVLRGPQGTLYGAGSEGGTVRFIMTAPSVEKYSMYSRAEVASTRKGEPTYEAGVAGGGPLIDNVLGFRASAWTRRDGGWLDRYADTEFSDGRLLERDSNSSEISSGRLALLWKPADNFTVSPAFFYQDNRTNDSDLYWERDGVYSREGAIPVDARSESKIFSNTMTLDAGPVQITAVTSYLDALGLATADISLNDAKTLVLFGGLTQEFLAEDPDFFGGVLGLQPYDPPGLPQVLAAFPDYLAAYETRSRMKQWSQELRVQSADPDSRVSWVAGLYWQDTRSSSAQAEPQPLLFPVAELAIGPSPNLEFWLPGALLPGGISYRQDTRNNDKQTAAFADVTVGLTERLKLTGGLRIATTEFEFQAAQAGPWVGDPRSDSGKQEEEPVTPKIGVIYDLDQGVWYATAAKGYRIGGANGSLAAVSACTSEVEQRFGAGNDNPLTYDSDTVWSYEIGGKKSGIAERFEVAASVFRIEWSGIQSQVTLDCLFNYTDNLGDAVSQGFDLSVNAVVTDMLAVGADIGYVDAHLTTNTYRSGATSPVGADDPLLAKKDDSLGGPKWTAHVFADYRRPFTGGDLYIRSDYSFQDSYAIDPRSADVVGSDNLLLGDTDKFHTVSARIGYRTPTWDIGIFADNLFDSTARIWRTDFAGALTARSPRPRTFGVTATYSIK